MNIRIAPKIGLFASIVIVTVATTVGLVVYHRAKTLLVQHEEVDLADETKIKAYLIQNYISNMREDALRLAGMPLIHKITEARATNDMQNSDLDVWRRELQDVFQEACFDEPVPHQKTDPGNDDSELKVDGLPKPYYQIRLIDKNGREIVRVERTESNHGKIVFDKIPLEDLDTQDKYLKKRPYIEKTMKLGPQKILLSEVDLNHEGGGIEKSLQPVMRASVPVYNLKGEVHAIIIINLDFGMLKELVLSPRHRIYLANQSGDFLIHPDSRKEFVWDIAKDKELRKKFNISPDATCRIQDQSEFEELKPFYLPNTTDQEEKTLSGNKKITRDMSYRFSKHIALSNPFWLMRWKFPDAKNWGAEKRSQLDSILKKLRRNSSLSLVTFPRRIIHGQSTNFVISAPLTSEGQTAILETEKILKKELSADQVEREYSQPVECRNYAVNFFPLYFDKQQPARHMGIVMAFSLDEMDADLSETTNWIVFIVILCITVGVGLAFWFSHTLTRPLVQTTRAAEQIAEGNFDVFLPVTNRDETGDLARGIQHMLHELDTRQSEIRIREARLRLIVDSAAEGIISLDEQGKILTLNSAVERMLGYTEAGDSRVINQFVSQLVSREYQSILENCLIVLRADESKTPSVSLEARAKRIDGTKFPVELSISSVRVEQQFLFTVIMRDITERKQAENERKLAKKKLEQAVLTRTGELREANKELKVERNRAEELNNAKDAFLASVSHELRNPLNQVTGFCQLLEFTELDDSQRDDLKKIRFAAGQLLDLINDILDYQKIIMGGMNLEPEDFEVIELMNEVRDGLEVQSNENNNKVIFEVQDDLGLLFAERRRVRQILINLIGNACKFTKDGTVTIAVTRKSSHNNQWIDFDVRDTGRGMSDKEQQKLFTPFTKLSSKDGNRTGTGLGLVICKGLCELMRGEIRLESKLGEGTTFTMRLPVGELDLLPDHQAPSAEPQKEDMAQSEDFLEEGMIAEDDSVGTFLQATQTDSVNISAESISRRTVLVIDDEPGVREMMQRHLSGRGFLVVTASTGQQGFEMAKRLQPAVITLDVLMPEVDGWTVLSALKKDEQTSSIPVVMVTIADIPAEMNDCEAIEYLAKPIDWEKLSRLLSKHTGSKRDQTILVVDDEAPTREILRRALERDSWKVLEAANGEEALLVLEKAKPAVILLDLMMPVMNGFEFLAEYAQFGERFSIPIVVITSKEPTPKEKEYLDSLVVRVLNKGLYSQEDLLEEIHRRVDMHIRKKS